MSSLRSFRLQARYNILTPVALLGLGLASPVFAASQEIVAGESFTNNTVIEASVGQDAVFSAGNISALTNNGAIFGDVEGNGVFINGDAASITNNANTAFNKGIISSSNGWGLEVTGSVERFNNFGEIRGGSNLSGVTGSTVFNSAGGVYIDGAVTSFQNSGAIISDSSDAVVFGDDVGSFLNSGNILGENYGVYFEGSVDKFENTSAGTVGGDDSGAVRIDGDVTTSFINAGSIYSEGSTAVYIQGSVASFINSGTIESDESSAVYISGEVGSFKNSGTIVTSDLGVYIGGDVGSFENTATGTIRSTDSSYAVYISGDVTTFSNAGIISASSYTAVYLNGDVGSFTNSGTITSGTSDAVYISGNVDSFLNSGRISAEESTAVDIGGNVGSFVNSGLIFSGSSRAVYISGNVESFANSGEIVSDDSTAVYIGGDVGSFNNSGLILSATSQAVDISGNVENFTNSGVITSDESTAVDISGDVETFSNSGVISSGSSNAIDIGGYVDSFVNSGDITSGTVFGGGDTAINIDEGVGSFVNTGSIIALGNLIGSSDFAGVRVYGDVGTFSNSGTISALGGDDASGVYVEGSVGAFENSGTIEGDGGAGTSFESAGTFRNTGTIRGAVGSVFRGGAEGTTYINSGIVESTEGGLAIDFASGVDDTLVIETGSQIIGSVDFGGDAGDQFDFSGFRGNLVLETDGSLADGNVVNGRNFYLQDENQVIVVGADSIGLAYQPVFDLVDGLRTLVDGQSIAGDQITAGAATPVVLGYAPRPVETGASAAAGALGAQPATAHNGKIWASAIAGGSAGTDSDTSISDAYTALMVGTQAALNKDVTVGVTAGYARSGASFDGGTVDVTSDYGIAGIYGNARYGVVTLDFSLFGGIASNESERDITTADGIETGTASYGSWFLAPEIGASVPVLANEMGVLKVVGKAGYIGGGFGGYTESGTDFALTVGDRSIGVFTGSLGLSGETVMGHTAHGAIKARGSVGAFALNNIGSDSPDVSVLDSTLIGYQAPDGFSYGVQGAVSLEAPLTQDISLSTGLKGSLRSDGVVSATANVGVGGKF